MYQEAVTGLEGIKDQSKTPRKPLVLPSDITDWTNLVILQGTRQAILGMVRHPYANQSSQREARLTATEALKLLQDKTISLNKRSRGNNSHPR